MSTDYIPGVPPVPVGTIVLYAYLPEDSPEKEWEIVEHQDPTKHPNPPPLPPTDEAYPDGVAYFLWPVGVPRKFGMRHQAVGWVRRTSFRIKESEKS